MTLPEIVMWTVVAVVGVPSMWRNPTAAALVLAWLAGQGIYLVTGDNLPVEYYVFPDAVVIAVIASKFEWCNLAPYRGLWHQLSCLLLERSPADRIVLAIFPLMWLLYLSPLDPFHTWYALWGLVLAQFVAAGIEAFQSYRRGADAADQPDEPGALLIAYRGGRTRGYG